jgi:hypothetical protein
METVQVEHTNPDPRAAATNLDLRGEVGEDLVGAAGVGDDADAAAAGDVDDGVVHDAARAVREDRERARALGDLRHARRHKRVKELGGLGALHAVRCFV